MKGSSKIPLVSTIRERCRVCYTCVRECPAKAIRIADGQAEVISERCIGCGNCVRVCGQHAKQVYDSTVDVRRLLAGNAKVAAMVAPSFPAEFTDWDYRDLTGILRALGFDYVAEVAFGADLVADRYRRLMLQDDGRSYIATSCPAIVAYVERYFPDLTRFLAPVVSPMVATARALRRLHGPNLKTVFVGPCIAKKNEAISPTLADEVDAVLTFVELRQMAGERDLSRHCVAPSDFDPPHAGPGALFPISHGLLQAAEIPEDLAACDVVVAGGRSGFVDAIKAFQTDHSGLRLLEVLACEGCIMGPGVSSREPLFRRRTRVSQFVRDRLNRLDYPRWRRWMAEFAGLDLGRAYQPDDQRVAEPSPRELAAILERMGKYVPEDELNCGACGYETCREHGIAIYKGLAESEMCLPYTIERLRETIENLAISNEALAKTQETLMQAEKLASMGQLAAGIAHELNNPLGVVLMYAHILEQEQENNPALMEDLTMIKEQADRCKKIVSGLLHFARQNKVLRRGTDLRELIDRSLKTVVIPDNVTVTVEHNVDDPVADLDDDQIMQALCNLIGNACAAMPDGGRLTIQTMGNNNRVELRVCDTGPGIPKEHADKIFEPFFTTKPYGKGTGLGLAITYGIVKMHSGDIRVESNTDPRMGPTGATFIISLPRHAALAPVGQSGF